MTGIIDYGGGNLRSVLNAFRFLDQATMLVSSPADLGKARRLVFPGQGTFGQCATQLAAQDLLLPMREWILARKSFLGICIGYQLLFEGSDESPESEGLAVLPGQVLRFPRTSGLKIPHMGWNKVGALDCSDPMWKGTGSSPYYYFVHSYHPEGVEPSVVSGVTSYGKDFPSAIRKNNLWGVQFHPEKSQRAGLQLLRNFIEHTA